MPLPWIKMWLEALDDPKLTRLSLAERGAWWAILKLAGKCEANGKIVSGEEALGIADIADALHIKTGEDRQSLESMIAKMEKRGSLIWNENHVLTVVHWEERQRVPPSARPEAVADRVRRHRERQKMGESEAVGELAVISTLYEENIGVLTPVVADSLKDIAERYPPGWFGEALKDAVARGARNLKYIEKILERWKVEGFKAPKAKEGGRGEQRGRGVRPKPKQERRRPITRTRGDED